MHGIGRYVRQEKKITAAGQAGIWARWRWGLLLLADDRRMTKNGNLKHGVLDELIRGAVASGGKLSEREIRYRLTAARAYPTEAQIRHAGADFEDWTSLREAGFPAYEAPPGEPLADARDAEERARDLARQLAELAGDQMSLFPDDKFGPLATLDELSKYAEDMVELTRRFHDRDVERAAYLRQLVDAVGGNMAATWEQAERALRAA